MKEVAAVGSFLDFRDLSAPAGELDMIADFEITHPLLPRAFHHFDFLFFKLVKLIDNPIQEVKETIMLIV